MPYTELLPYYGRDYTSGKAAQQDFSDGRDFITADTRQACSIRDFLPGGPLAGHSVILRYKRLMNTATGKVTPTLPDGAFVDRS